MPPDYVQLKNNGAVCELIGTNIHGASLIRNNHGKDLLFNQGAFKPAPYGQYCACKYCHSPVLTHGSASIVCKFCCTKLLIEHMNKN